MVERKREVDRMKQRQRKQTEAVAAEDAFRPVQILTEATSSIGSQLSHPETEDQQRPGLRSHQPPPSEILFNNDSISKI